MQPHFYLDFDISDRNSFKKRKEKSEKKRIEKRFKTTLIGGAYFQTSLKIALFFVCFHLCLNMRAKLDFEMLYEFILSFCLKIANHRKCEKCFFHLVFDLINELFIIWEDRLWLYSVLWSQCHSNWMSQFEAKVI